MTTLDTSTYRAAFSWKDFFSSFLLLEMFKGMAITGKYMFAKKITGSINYILLLARFPLEGRKKAKGHS